MCRGRGAGGAPLLWGCRRRCWQPVTSLPRAVTSWRSPGGCHPVPPGGAVAAAGLGAALGAAPGAAPGAARRQGGGSGSGSGGSAAVGPRDRRHAGPRGCPRTGAVDRLRPAGTEAAGHPLHRLQGPPESFDHNLHPAERFSPCDLIKKIKEQREELGLIIDLTYTTRYYRPEELPATLCYSKIWTMGHEIPNNQTIFQFKSVVKNFLRDNKDNDKLIGVHCTHGLNRTGYLVCRYLIDVEGMEPNAAIELFNRARGHPIERMNYIEDLQKRSRKKNCGAKNLGLDLLKGKADSTSNTRKQTAEHHPHHSEQFPLAMPRNSGSTKKNRKQGHKAPTQHQELVHKHRVPEQRWPCSLGPRNCPVSLPHNRQHNRLCFPAMSSQHQPQEMHTARKRRRWRRKPVTV
nr:RNA/RNP complex-1-interacting phosphatase isoform X1 [Anas platyrhynchos]